MFVFSFGENNCRSGGVEALSEGKLTGAPWPGMLLVQYYCKKSGARSRLLSEAKVQLGLNIFFAVILGIITLAKLYLTRLDHCIACRL